MNACPISFKSNYNPLMPKKLCTLDDKPIVGMCFNLGFNIQKELPNFKDYPLASAESCADAIHTALHKGFIDKQVVKSVCDFGAGSGVPTFILKNTFKLDDDNIVALNKENIIKPGLLSDSSVIVGDGTEYLKSGAKQFDLVTACMLGPISERERAS